MDALLTKEIVPRENRRLCSVATKNLPETVYRMWGCDRGQVHPSGEIFQVEEKKQSKFKKRGIAFLIKHSTLISRGTLQDGEGGRSTDRGCRAQAKVGVFRLTGVTSSGQEAAFAREMEIKA